MTSQTFKYNHKQLIPKSSFYSVKKEEDNLYKRSQIFSLIEG